MAESVIFCTRFMFSIFFIFVHLHHRKIPGAETGDVNNVFALRRSCTAPAQRRGAAERPQFFFLLSLVLFYDRMVSNCRGNIASFSGERFASIFCIRMRRVFAAILDVLQENAGKIRRQNFRKAPQTQWRDVALYLEAASVLSQTVIYYNRFPPALQQPIAVFPASNPKKSNRIKNPARAARGWSAWTGRPTRSRPRSA